MVTHPRRSQASIDAAIKRLIAKHQLDTIEFYAGLHVTAARAMPASHHPIIRERREADLGDRSLSMREASAMREKWHAPLATGSGKTMDEALSKLTEALDALSPTGGGR